MGGMSHFGLESEMKQNVLNGAPLKILRSMHNCRVFPKRRFSEILNEIDQYSSVHRTLSSAASLSCNPLGPSKSVKNSAQFRRMV